MDRKVKRKRQKSIGGGGEREEESQERREGKFRWMDELSGWAQGWFWGGDGKGMRVPGGLK